MKNRADERRRASARPAGRRSDLLLADRIASLEAEVSSSRTKARLSEELHKLGSWEFDLNSKILAWSDGAYRIFGVSPDMPISVERALSFYAPDTRVAIRAALLDALDRGTPYDLTVPFMKASGEPGWLRTLGSAQLDAGARRIVGVVEDVTADKAADALARSQTRVGLDAVDCKTDEHLQTLEAVRQAIDDDRLVVFYQPIVDLRTGIVRGMEALARWNHPTRGILPPSEFEAALADPILSVAIDDVVLKKSLEQMRLWIDQGVPIAAVNVNASQAQLQRIDLVERIEELLGQNGLTPERLKIEVLETAFLGRDTRQVATTIDRLARLGVVCALDDFGTGYASLCHLRQFRVERIKIDRSFVANICEDAFDRGLTKSLIDLGRNLGIRVTAEGVETERQLALLRDFGCDCAQGYLVGRPSAAQDVPAMIERWHASQAIAPKTVA